MDDNNNSEPFVAIVNGAAGGGRCRSRADVALDRLRDHGLELEVHFTHAAGHATELAAEAWERGARHFLAFGGDGTSYEVVNGLFPRASADDKPVLGILPLGTGNSFLRDFGITSEEAAFDALSSRRRRAVDVIEVRHKDGVLHYINILGLGFTAAAGGLMNRRFKALGSAGYVAAVCIEVIRLKHPVDAIRLDGGDVDERPAVFLSFSNSRYTGGTMMMAPDADPTDGEVDVIRAGGLSRRGLLGTFPRIFTGTHVDHPDVEQCRSKRVEFVDPREQDVMVDGEVMRLCIESIEVLPGALELMA
ncbi:MAG: diacylglycerol kinase family lipid kinase [Deltaproteobacteria bacterium]|nr:diacylglycerol kinase family lipid kinase [Deltaproteobacteria bacterium]